MSEHADVVMESASSSAGSIVAKTVAGGSSLGAPGVLPFMQSPILLSLSPGDICQIVGTAYIIGLVIVALTKKYTALKRLNKKLYDSTLMGGSGGNGP
jgi:hypothetical protein